MRTRKYSICADTFEEYKQKAIVQYEVLQGCSINKSNISHNLFTTPFQVVFNSKDIQNTCLLNSTLPNSPKRRNPWAEFDYDTPTTSVGNIKDHSINKSSNYRLEDSDNEEFESLPFKKLKTSIVKRFMVLGAGNCGKHLLVNSIFDSQDQGHENMHTRCRQSMDLIIKESDIDCSKYQFWVRNIDDYKFEDVVKVYYKKALIFFFVYSITDRESFIAVERCIKKIQKEVASKDFIGVLVGNKNDVNDRNVMLEEGILLKEKYSLKYFIETNCYDKELKEKFLILVR